jgi:HSP20 family protein
MTNLMFRDNRELSRGRTRVTFWDPFRMVDDLLRWERSNGNEAAWSQGGEFVPTFEVKETKDAYLIKADLPGIKAKDLEISLTGNFLQVFGRREQEARDDGDRYYAAERPYGQFTRCFALPDGADAERLTADLNDGVLTVHVSKKAEVQPRRIPIDTGSEKVKS